MGRLKFWVKIALFISSFTPLIVIWSLRLTQVNFNIFDREIKLIYLIFFVTLISIIILILSLEHTRRSNNPDKIKIVSIEDLNSSHIEYLLAYVFGFLPLSQGSILAFFIFIAVLLVVYLKSNLLYVNPLLVVMGYEILKIRDSKDREIILITRKKPLKGITLGATMLNSNIFVEKR